jgi:hypothetical protein
MKGGSKIRIGKDIFAHLNVRTNLLYQFVLQSCIAFCSSVAAFPAIDMLNNELIQCPTTKKIRRNMFHLYRVRLRAAVAASTAKPLLRRCRCGRWRGCVRRGGVRMRAAVAESRWSAPACKNGGRGGGGRMRPARAATTAIVNSCGGSPVDGELLLRQRCRRWRSPH